jgi:hypothetical protein
LSEVFGGNPANWHRLECSLDRYSLVGAMLQATERLPHHLVAD